MEVKYHWAHMWLAGLHRIVGRGASVVFPLHLRQLESSHFGLGISDFGLRLIKLK